MSKKLTPLVISFIVVAIAYLFYTNLKSVPSPVVTTKNGKLQGVISFSRDGREFYEYLNIPYSKRMVGELRFESPQPPDPWEGIRDASSYSNPCLQFESFITGFIIGSEDCLYLNVFVPKDTKIKALRNVMVYIHGGLFHVGSADVGGPKNFIDEDIIIVSINYRLGALGFLSTGDKVVRGNMGLKDQVMALKWVQENIAYFNGDPNSVTIFGESAGGASVHHHVISPKSKGRRVWTSKIKTSIIDFTIHQSGSSINYWAVYRNVRQQSQRFAKKFDCPVDDTIAMVSCLKKLDGRTLVGGHQDMMVFGLKSFFRTQISTFAPSIEVVKDADAFLTEEPLEILKSGRFNKVPIMTGCNSDEGLLISPVMIANQTKLNEANDDWETWAPRVLHYDKNLKEVTSKLRKFYFGDNKLINDTKYFQNYTNLFGDRLFTIPASQSARLESKYVPTHLYYYDYNGELSIGSVMANKEGKFHFVVNFLIHRLNSLFNRHILRKDLPHLGTSHGDEIGLLMSGKWFEGLFISRYRDSQMSKDVVKLWSDFAKDIKPLKFRNLEWPVLAKDVVKYLRISNEPAIIDEPFADRRKLWESLSIQVE